MKSYPYIGETVLGSVVLFHREATGSILKHVDRGPIGRVYADWDEDLFTNITREYLQNTCGEVVSPEHAEFIIELAKNAKCAVIDICKAKAAAYQVSGMHFNFYVDSGTLWVSFSKLKMARSRGEKQITIPLPPKADKQEASDFPQVGDKVTWGNKSVKGEVKALSDGLAWIKNEYGNHYTEYVNSLVKPKTPEDELRDELEIALNSYVISGKPASEHIDEIINAFKKPR